MCPGIYPKSVRQILIKRSARQVSGPLSSRFRPELKAYPCRIPRQPTRPQEELEEHKLHCFLREHRGRGNLTEDGNEDKENSRNDTHGCGVCSGVGQINTGLSDALACGDRNERRAWCQSFGMDEKLLMFPRGDVRFAMMQRGKYYRFKSKLGYFRKTAKPTAAVKGRLTVMMTG